LQKSWPGRDENRAAWAGRALMAAAEAWPWNTLTHMRLRSTINAAARRFL
jgi:hypothetical protein